ncbi:aminomethyl-transferring glycine dehydrogenase [archaeon]|jgi:glycine dehydrogenase subunit 1|nr:aminomethyl-transferring glycine dehydrogenase [archaeon]MDP6547949.1 aminomethyl-transferring glycine dehydrogenase subunit GcvPA [Candidatus Woesearchaeota archaeon]|tara:strand:+ start:92000 stop:93346 length:1347 start_codon:yes stop_codon:yes gene_type:complete
MTNYIPNSDKDKKLMMDAIGIKNTDELFTDIPKEKILTNPLNLPRGVSEIELRQNMKDICKKNIIPKLSFLGAGCYNHFIPSTVNSVISRSEFLTAYTPYQPEISQGSLQIMYEFQSMIASLSGMDAANASMYDGASALAEAASVTCLSKGKNTILISKSVHPEYRDVVRTYMKARDVNVIEIEIKDGVTDKDDLKNRVNEDVAAVIVQSPNFFGIIEDQEKISDIAHKNNALMVSCVTESISLGILKSPGSLGADIFIGEGQSFGLTPSFGGPHLGLFAVKKELVRKMPGRIVGKTSDADGKDAYVLTLQAREQHIRREKACSNICTNQGLCAIAASVYLSTVGKKLKDLAYQNMQKAHYAFDTLLQVDGCEKVFENPFFNEFVLKVKNSREIKSKLEEKNIIIGLLLEDFYPELKDCILFCVTELTRKEDIDDLAKELSVAIGDSL